MKWLTVYVTLVSIGSSFFFLLASSSSHFFHVLCSTSSYSCFFFFLFFVASCSAYFVLFFSFFLRRHLVFSSSCFLLLLLFTSLLTFSFWFLILFLTIPLLCFPLYIYCYVDQSKNVSLDKKLLARQFKRAKPNWQETVFGQIFPQFDPLLALNIKSHSILRTHQLESAKRPHFSLLNQKLQARKNAPDFV